MCLFLLTVLTKAGCYPIYVTGAQGVFNYGDNKSEPLFGPSLQWFADEYDSSLLAAFRRTTEPTQNEDKENTGIQKFTVHPEDIEDAKIYVILEPWVD